jgi:hypothetical protein
MDFYTSAKIALAIPMTGMFSSSYVCHANEDTNENGLPGTGSFSYEARDVGFVVFFGVFGGGYGGAIFLAFRLACRVGGRVFSLRTIM